VPIALSPLKRFWIVLAVGKSDAGSILVGDQREFVRSWQNLQEVTVKGNHFIKEHSPEEIGVALKNFIKSI